MITTSFFFELFESTPIFLRIFFCMVKSGRSGRDQGNLNGGRTNHPKFEDGRTGLPTIVQRKAKKKCQGERGRGGLPKAPQSAMQRRFRLWWRRKDISHAGAVLKQRGMLIWNMLPVCSLYFCFLRSLSSASCCRCRRGRRRRGR